MSLPAPSPRPREHLFAILLLWLLFYASFTLVTPPLLDDADSVHAEVAREMLLRHDWVTLYADGIRYLEKAPLLYWSMASSFSLFGVHTSAARLPLALTVLALALVLESFARRAFPASCSPARALPESGEPARTTRAGLYAALLLLSSFGIFIFTRITIPDVMVCLWLTLALFAFWLTEQTTPPADPDRLDTPSVAVSPQSAETIPPNIHRSGAPSIAALSRWVGTKAPNINRPGAPSIAALSRWVGTKAPLRLLSYAFAACCALNVLTKGLIGIVFPTGIVLTYLLLTRGLRCTLRRLRQLHPLSSLLVFLAIAAPWHILIGLANPTQGSPGRITFTRGHWIVPSPTQGNVHGWTWFYFVNEHLLRYLNLRVPRDYDTVPLALFWGLLLIWLMPWSAFLYRALTAIEWRAALVASPLLKRLRWLQSRLNPTHQTAFLTPEEATRLLLGLWAVIPLLFFSFSTRQEYYVLPSIPPLLLLIAAWLNDEAVEAETFAIPNPLVRSGQRLATLLLVLGSVIALVLAFFLLHSQAPAPNTDLASLLQQNPGDYALSFGHFLDLNARALGAFRTPLTLTLIALFGGTLANWLLRRDYRPHLANLALAAATFLFLIAAHLGLQLFAPVLSSQQLAQAIAPVLRHDDLIVIHGEYEAASSLGFYLRRPSSASSFTLNGAPIHILDGRSSNLWYGSFFPDAPPLFETTLSLNLQWTGPRRIFLWQGLNPDDPPLPRLPGRIFFIAQSGGKEILSNQPNPY